MMRARGPAPSSANISGRMAQSSGSMRVRGVPETLRGSVSANARAEPNALLRTNRPHRTACLCHRRHGHQSLGGHLPPLRRHPNLLRPQPRPPLPRTMVPIRNRPAPKLDARLRSNAGTLHPDRPAGTRGWGERVWVRASEPGEVYGPDRRSYSNSIGSRFWCWLGSGDAIVQQQR